MHTLWHGIMRNDILLFQSLGGQSSTGLDPLLFPPSTVTVAVNDPMLCRYLKPIPRDMWCGIVRNRKKRQCDYIYRLDAFSSNSVDYATEL